MSGKVENEIGRNPFLNPLVLDSVFKNLSPSDLINCRLVHQLWNSVAIQAIKKALNTRLLLCADQKCARNLEKFLKCFQTSRAIPFTKAILILDHLPTTFALDISEILEPESWKSDWRNDRFNVAMAILDEAFETPNPFNSCNYSKILYSATSRFSPSIENLIVTLTLHQETVENMETWLKKLEFPNLLELHFHVTKTSPEDMSLESFEQFINSAPKLETFGIRKLCKNSDEILCKLIKALGHKINLNKVKKLSIEVFTDDKEHLRILASFPLLMIEHLSLIYLGGEVRFVDKLQEITKLIDKVSPTLRYLKTHLPLFSGGWINFPKVPWLHTLKIEKVYREFAVEEQRNIFDFEFSKYFPNLKRIKFRDYDSWKNAQMSEQVPEERSKVCRIVVEISLPDLCFDAPLMRKYLKTFPNIRKLSCVVCYLSKHQVKCTFAQVYELLPRLKELDVQIYDVDVPVYDRIFVGFSSEESMDLKEIKLHCDFENVATLAFEKKESIACLQDLEILKITYFNDAKALGISDLTVLFGLLKLKSLKRLTIGPSLISNEGFSLLTKNVDVIRLQRSKHDGNNQSSFPSQNSSEKYDCGHMCF